MRKVRTEHYGYIMPKLEEIDEVTRKVIDVEFPLNATIEGTFPSMKTTPFKRREHLYKTVNNLLRDLTGRRYIGPDNWWEQIDNMYSKAHRAVKIGKPAIHFFTDPVIVIHTQRKGLYIRIKFVVDNPLSINGQGRTSVYNYAQNEWMSCQDWGDYRSEDILK